MKRSRVFRTSHKKGRTNLHWKGGRFIRTDFGDYLARKEFDDEGDFLRFLRQFYDWETSKSDFPSKVSEIDAWTLILGLVRDG